ncbi:MAG: type II toxin-antitoxin system MqsA family antitoxin [bacterium]
MSRRMPYGKAITKPERREEELLVIRDVPADVCQQCNEAYISAGVSERLDHFLSEYHRHRPERYLAVPQYSAVQAIGE